MIGEMYWVSFLGYIEKYKYIDSKKLFCYNNFEKIKKITQKTKNHPA